MSIPAFDEGTGYLPAGEHVASWEEVEERFGWNLRRRRILEGLNVVVAQLRAKGVWRIWLDGSFVTAKERPSDVDVVYQAPPGSDPQSWGPLAPGLANRRRLKARYRVDLWRYPSPQLVSSAESGTVDIKAFFSADVDGIEKGLVALEET